MSNHYKHINTKKPLYWYAQSWLRVSCILLVTSVFAPAFGLASLPSSSLPKPKKPTIPVSQPTTHKTLNTTKRLNNQQQKKKQPKNILPVPPHMALIEQGYYTPLYKKKNNKKVFVSSFYLDIYPVTNQDFLAFVRANPRWQRKNIVPIFAGKAYLSHWPHNLSLGKKAALLAKAPVTHVAWFPAKYYCKWKGKRLPTLAEWEYAASASKTRRQGNKEPGYNSRILQWYSRPTPKHLPPVGSTFRNVWGVYDLHGLIWEWVLDFQTALVTGESRGDSEINRQLFCGAGSVGTSDFRNYAAFMRYALRSSLKADYTTANLGFRCALSIAQWKKQRKAKGKKQ